MWPPEQGHKRSYSIHLALSVLGNTYSGGHHRCSVLEPNYSVQREQMKKPTLRRTEAPQPIALSFFRHESEKTFRFQLPAFKSSKPRYWEIEISLPHCVLSKFLTHRIYKNNKWLFYTTKFWYNLLQSQRPTPDILHERYQISRHHM